MGGGLKKDNTVLVPQNLISFNVNPVSGVATKSNSFMAIRDQNMAYIAGVFQFTKSFAVNTYAYTADLVGVTASALTYFPICWTGDHVGRGYIEGSKLYLSKFGAGIANLDMAIINLVFRVT